MFIWCCIRRLTLANLAVQDLGLGVLEEKRDGDSSDESEDEGTKDEQDESDIIGKLMGGKPNKQENDKPSIQEMAE